MFKENGGKMQFSLEAGCEITYADFEEVCFNCKFSSYSLQLTNDRQIMRIQTLKWETPCSNLDSVPAVSFC